MREAKPPTADVGWGGKPVLDRLEGEEASEDAPDEGRVTGMRRVIGGCGCSGNVTTLPCREWPGRGRGAVGVSVLGMLRLWEAVDPAVGASEGTGPIMRGLASGVVLLVLVEEKEASLTGDVGRC